MNSSSKKGRIIVIDGIDGTGKATQASKLKERFEKEGKKVQMIDFPQYENNFGGRVLRKILDGEFGRFLDVDPFAASLYYAADRRQSMPQIKAWVDEGFIVIVDRYVSSSMMHQGAKIADQKKAYELVEWLDKLEHELLELPRPDVIVYLNVTAEIAAKLMRKREKEKGRPLDTVETEIQHMIDSRKRALAIVEHFGTWEAIDCSDPLNEETGLKEIPVVHDLVFAAVNKHL